MSEEEFDPSRPIEEALAEGVRLFNAGEYEESHEEFEHGWLSSEANDSEFFKGLVQAGICLHKLQQGQLDGAEKLHAGMRRYLAAFLPSHRGVDVAALMDEMRPFIKGACEQPQAIDWSGAPKMKLEV
ncbi:MAG: DUF309 domain-containing protein [Planctomycetes bacterium]|nr:DUF309 domain-containing protein [Planctomycetota bacterium]